MNRIEYLEKQRDRTHRLQDELSNMVNSPMNEFMTVKLYFELSDELEDIEEAIYAELRKLRPGAYLQTAGASVLIWE